MEHPEKTPQRHGELHDPKLPVIHGSTTGNRSTRIRRRFRRIKPFFDRMASSTRRRLGDP